MTMGYRFSVPSSAFVSLFLCHRGGGSPRDAWRESPGRILGAGDDALWNAAECLVSANEGYCLIHLVPFDHSIEWSGLISPSELKGGPAPTVMLLVSLPSANSSLFMLS